MKPIFVYAGYLHLDAQAQKLLEQHTFCYRGLKELVNALDRYLSTGWIMKHVDLNDKKFLKTYGISSRGGEAEQELRKCLKVYVGYKKVNEKR